ncbi:MAG: N-acetyltransferase family protein [Halothiobacillaceae bacterium]
MAKAMRAEVSRETFRRATQSDIPAIRVLAERIWWHTYPPIIGDTQTRYMLDLMYAPRRIAADMDAGHRYFLFLREDLPCGFHAIEPAYEGRAEFTRLHKLYLDPGLQGLGLGQRLIARAVEDALACGSRFMDLTVNKYNERAIAAYRRAGFEVSGSIVKPIGEGYVMDDFIMHRRLR